MLKILYKIFLILFLLLIILKIPLVYSAELSIDEKIYIRLFFICIIIIESIILFKDVFITGKLNKLANIGTVLFSFYFIFLLLEAIFMFVPKSHSANYTLGAILWLNKYWKEINSFGCRDIEPDNTSAKILFVGDSFTAGHGLKKTDDRYSNIVRKELLRAGRDYSVANLGINGLDTRGEYNFMIDYIRRSRIVPKKIILQYFGNDIEQAAIDNNMNFKGFTPYSDVPDVLKLLFKGSYIINYIYWMFPKQDEAPYVNSLKSAYNNEDVLSQHKNDLKQFIDYANANSDELIVVIFPFMNNLELSNSLYVNKIVKYFEENNVKTINVSNLVKNMPLRDRIVNLNDAHASIKVNILVAKEILKQI